MVGLAACSTEHKLVESCRQVVLGLAKSPSTVVFVETSFSERTQIYAVSVEFDAENSFSAMGRGEAECQFDKRKPLRLVGVRHRQRGEDWEWVGEKEEWVAGRRTR